MKILDRFAPPKERHSTALSLNSHEEQTFTIKGHVFGKFNHNDGRVEEFDLGKNVITTSASILLARLIRDNTDPANGAFALAVGLGGVGWNLQSPPPATSAQTQLANELYRQQFQSINFTVGGVISPTPTNVIDLTCVFLESAAVGALVEMGIVGGDATLVANTGTLINYKTFAVINKPPTATLSVTWRLTF